MKNHSLAMEFNASQLSVEVLKSIFDAAFIETEVDGDGELFVKDDLCVWVEGMPEKEAFSYTAIFGIDKGHPRIKLLEACNSFNEHYIGLKAVISDDSESLIFVYAVLMKGGGSIAGKEIVRLLRYFQDVVRASMADEAFEFLTQE